MGTADDDERAEAARRATQIALLDKPGVRVARMDSKKVGRVTWECEWELSDGVQGSFLSFPVTIRREGEE
jgi:hypothetical protein